MSNEILNSIASIHLKLDSLTSKVDIMAATYETKINMLERVTYGFVTIILVVFAIGSVTLVYTNGMPKQTKASIIGQKQ